MINATKIELTRAEGRTHECVTTIVTGDDVWNQANRVLSRWSTTAPKNGGYHKCDFTVTYADGETYEGRYDLTHFTVESPNLARHVRSFVECYSFRRAPSHMDAETWGQFKANVTSHDPEGPAKFAQFLDAYQIGA